MEFDIKKWCWILFWWSTAIFFNGVSDVILFHYDDSVFANWNEWWKLTSDGWWLFSDGWHFLKTLSLGAIVMAFFPKKLWLILGFIVTAIIFHEIGFYFFR